MRVPRVGRPASSVDGTGAVLPLASPVGGPPNYADRAGLVSFLLPLLAAAASLAATWKCWINPLVDSGRELDVPFRLAQGERLYRDVTYYYGPLGPWINAAALRLFGARWLVLEIVCAALALCIFVLMFRITRRAGSVLSAWRAAGDRRRRPSWAMARTARHGRTRRVSCVPAGDRRGRRGHPDHRRFQ